MDTVITPSYKIINKYMTVDEIKEQYGDVSYAFTEDSEGIFVVAISDLEPQYLKTRLLVDKIHFQNVNTVMELDYFGGVI